MPITIAPSPIPQASTSARASQVLANGVPPGVPQSYCVLADHGRVPHSTLHHRDERTGFPFKRLLSSDLSKEGNQLEIQFPKTQFLYDDRYFVALIPNIKVKHATPYTQRGQFQQLLQ